MPEHHERNKEKKGSVFTGECGDVEYGLRLYECNASSARDKCSGAVNEVSSNIKVKVNPQQIATSLSHKESCFNQHECGLQLDEEVSNNETEYKSKSTLDENDVIVPETKHREVSILNELSGIGQDLSLTENDHAEGTQEKDYPEKNYPLQQDLNSIESFIMAVTYKESSEIVYDTLRLINEAIQLEDESTKGNATCSVNQETEFMLEVTNVEQMDTENAPQSTTFAKKDSLPKLQRANSEHGTENGYGSRKSIPVLYETPLVFPEISNISISILSGSSEKKEKMRCTRTTPHESIGEQTITRDTTDVIDSLGRKPPDNNLAHADTHQKFDIEVRTHPDGGWGWVVCLGAFLVQFIVLGMQNTAGIVYTELVKVLKSQRGATAWVGSLATGIMFFLGPLTTSLCERLGCRIVTICGGLICIAGLLLSSIVSSLLPLYFTYGLMFGTGTSLCYFPTIIVLSKYFKRRIAVVNGLVTSGSGVGTLVIGPVVQALFLRFGVANTFRTVAAIFSLVLICGATFRPVSAKYSQHTNRTNRGEARKLFDWSIFKNKGYVIWVASLGTFQLGYFVPFVHLVRHAEDLGVSPTDASFLIGYLSVASTVGRLFFGKMADLSCVNRIRMYQLGVFSIGLCSFFVPLATGYGGLTAYAITFGFFEACFVLLIPLVTSDIVGAEKMSYGLGSAFTVMAFPMFLGPPIAGWMYDVLGDYAGAFYFCGVISLTAALFMFFVPLSSTKTKSSRLRKLLKRNDISHFGFLRRLFGCFSRKELHESKTLSNVQYSVIIKSEGVENV